MRQTFSSWTFPEQAAGDTEVLGLRGGTRREPDHSANRPELIPVYVFYFRDVFFLNENDHTKFQSNRKVTMLDTLHIVIFKVVSQSTNCNMKIGSNDISTNFSII